MKILKKTITETIHQTKRYWFIIKNQRNKEYSVWIEVVDGKVVDYSCDCIFSSFFRFSTKNKGKICRHIKFAIKTNLLRKHIIIN